MKRVIPILFILLPLLVTAQTSNHKAHLKSSNFAPAQSLSTDQFLKNHFSELGLEKPEDLKEKISLPTKNNWTRHRYTQNYKGLEVIGSSYILHTKNNQVKKSTGFLLPNIDIDIAPSKSQNDIVNDLKRQILDLKSIEEKQTEDFFKTFTIEQTELVIIDKAFPAFSGNYTLAYKVVANNIFPQYDRADYLLDAKTGKLIYADTHVCSSSVEGIAKTRYYGEQTITVDSVSPNKYILFDEGRNIRTLDANETYNFNLDGYTDFEDEDNYWDNANDNLDEIAGDLHYCTSAYHDFMLNNFGWKGVDGIGGELISVGHILRPFYLNAFWDGNSTNYGNGRCTGYGPLTTLDVVGHEFAHGFTDYTSDLIYQNESGALNESISDIIGKAVEFAYDPAEFNWYIGDKFIDEGLNSFRNMADPNEYNDPKYYKGLYWITNPDFDRGGVHINSGLYNYWFYLLVEGGTGTNEGAYDFNVPSIGWEDALDIVFGTQLAYFGLSTNYFEAYQHTLEYTKDAFGEQSAQYSAVEEAWRAVGLETKTDEYTISGKLEGSRNKLDFCASDCKDVNVEIVNYSAEAVMPMQNIFLNYTIDNTLITEENITIQSAFEPGDTIFYTFQRPICADDIVGGNFADLQVNLSLFDNTDYQELFTSNLEKSSAGEIDLELSSATRSNDICSPDFNEFTYRLRNRGCTLYESGQSIDIVYQINGQTIEESFTLSDDLHPGEIYNDRNNFIFVDFPLARVNDYTITIFPQGDSDLTNNSVEGSMTAHEIMGQQIEEFTNYNAELSTWIEIDPYFRNFASALDIGGNQKLVVGGTSTQSWSQPCAKAEDIFLETTSETDLFICFSTNGMSDPVLRYEYTPYYSGTVDGVDPAFTSMSQVSIYDENTFEVEMLDVDLGLAEGEETTLSYDLPIGNGDIVLSVICMHGDEAAGLAGDFSNGDYQIFDNIRIEERGMVAVEDDYLNEQIKIYPNPSDGIVFFESERQETFTTRIYTVDGRQIYTQNNIQDRLRWDNNHRISGLLFYEIEFEDGKTSRGKFIINN